MLLKINDYFFQPILCVFLNPVKINFKANKLDPSKFLLVLCNFQF